jgi:HK97 family phage major capsid protein
MTEVLDRDTAVNDDDGARARRETLRGSYRTLQEMEARQRDIVGELAGIDQLAEPGPDDLAWQGTIITEHDDLDALAGPLRKRAKDLERVRAAHADPANREGPERTPDLQTRNVTGLDPFRDLDRVRSNMVEPMEVRGRALDAIEMVHKRGDLEHDFAENATRLAQAQYRGQSKVAQHILQTGSPEYKDHFENYLRDPQGYSARAALSLTLANGGYLLPFVLDPTIILTNTGSANPFRRISEVKQTTSNTWNGVTSAGVNAALLAEGTIATDATPTVGTVAITPDKAAAWVFGSYEVLEDTDFGQQLPRLLADAKDRLEENNFAVGAGTAGIPQGVTVGATTVVTTATTLVIAVGDIYNTQQVLPPRFRNAPGCAWVANVAIINKFRQLDTAGGASFWTNLGKGQPETLLGAPIYESTSMASALTSNNLLAVMGDFGQFFIVDRVGVSLIYEPLVKGTGGILPAGQAGWFMFWRFSSQVAVPNAFRVMKGL